MNKSLFLPILLGAIVLFTFSLKGQESSYKYALIPFPASLQPLDGDFQVDPQTCLYFDPHISTKEQAGFLEQINLYTGLKISSSTTKTRSENYIRFTIDKSSGSVLSGYKGTEGYRLSITPNHIEIKAVHVKGLFYGLQSLIQLIRPVAKNQFKVPACMVKDEPRFAYRGMHLDVGRHMFPVSSLKKWIDLLAFYKINTFHWHLTDDQGWRIEIKKYPLLQSVSAYRKETIVGHKRANPHVFDGKSYGGYYTQEEIKDIVRYATERYINVIPEIDMPGHAQAVLAAYPKLGCTGGPYQTATFWGVFDDVFCAGREETFNFLTDVMDEVIPLFPSAYLHIGGDECPKTRWKACSHCQERIKTENLKDEHELQSYFIRRMERYLETKGRKIIGWDEILEGGLAPAATVMSWQGLEGGIAAAKMKHDVIMTPEKYVYLDYYQSYQENEQIAAGGFTPLSKVYAYEPVPEMLNAAESVYIKGVQANLWSEYLNTPEKAEYMMFPRIIALAEIAWTSENLKNYGSFLKRLKQHEGILDKFNVNYFKNYNEISAQTDFQDDVLKLSLYTTFPDAVIRYTTDGQLPTAGSLTYKDALVIDRTQQIMAAVFKQNKQLSPVFRKKFDFSKATGKTIHLTNQPKGNFAPRSPKYLLNGVSGSKLYNDGEWSGFSGENMEAVIDMGQLQEVSMLGINILKYHWQRMWEPELLKFELSADGKDYREVYRQNSFNVEGINEIRVHIPPIKARYVKVTAINKGIIPKGGYGAGGKAWLLADEIFVN